MQRVFSGYVVVRCVSSSSNPGSYAALTPGFSSAFSYAEILLVGGL